MKILSALLACCLALSTAGQLQPRCTTSEECRLMAREHRRQRRALERRAPSPTLTTVYSTCPVLSRSTATYEDHVLTPVAFTTTLTNSAPNCATIPAQSNYVTVTQPTSYTIIRSTNSNTVVTTTSVTRATQTLSTATSVVSTTFTVTSSSPLFTSTGATTIVSTNPGKTCYVASTTSTATDVFPLYVGTTITETDYACPTPTMTV